MYSLRRGSSIAKSSRATLKKAPILAQGLHAESARRRREANDETADPCDGGHYEQANYAALTGWKAPAVDGPTAKQLSAGQNVIDRQVRLTISRELGHEHEQVTAVYLGR